MAQAQTVDRTEDRKALILGVVVSTVLASTLVIAGLKAGITPGVSPLVILFAWGAFSVRVSSGGGGRFLNIAQVAGSAGMAVTAGVIFTAPLIQVLYANLGQPVPPVDVMTLIPMCLAGSLIGYGFVGLATKKFLTDPTLPAPEAVACETMIESATSARSTRPKLGRSLYAGLAASFLAPLIVRFGVAAEHVVLWSRKLGERTFQLDLPFTPIYIGIGGLLTLSTALLVFAGSAIRLVGDFALASMPEGGELALQFPSASMRWVGGGAMTVAVVYSLVKFIIGNKRGSQAASTTDESLLEIDDRARKGLIAAVAGGLAILVGWLVYTEGLTSFTVAMAVTVIV
ncbi:MAG: OPT/YSL family transporter, partial [Myxococcales bacterium]|nr:OPT/YSL family transporter [Myxococcales bacterium]